MQALLRLRFSSLFAIFCGILDKFRMSGAIKPQYLFIQWSS